MLVTEKIGPIWLVSAKGEKIAPLAGTPAVYWQGQNGMLGVFVSPRYATDESIYITYIEPGDYGGGQALAAIGAGSVLDSETARIAILAGAEYIVTPTFRRQTVELCNRYGVPTIIGAFTATEMLTAQEAGAVYIKVHPASLGGPKYF